MNHIIDFFFPFIFGASILVVGLRNPVHALLVLVQVFFMGSCVLMMLQAEYVAVLLVIVYVGAIVVLFLFIVMMLEIKAIHVAERFGDFLPYKGLILGVLIFEIIMVVCYDLFDMEILVAHNGGEGSAQMLREGNLHIEHAKLLRTNDQLRGLADVLFTEHKSSLLIAALLLFLSMVGSIALTLDTVSLRRVRGQDLNQQALREAPVSGTQSL